MTLLLPCLLWKRTVARPHGQKACVPAHHVPLDIRQACYREPDAITAVHFATATGTRVFSDCSGRCVWRERQLDRQMEQHVTGSGGLGIPGARICLKAMKEKNHFENSVCSGLGVAAPTAGSLG